MHCILIGPESITRYPALLLESADETWRCSLCSVGTPVFAPDIPQAVLLFPGHASVALLDALTAAPLFPPPWLIACGFDDPRCDLSLSPEALGALPSQIAAMDAAGRLPSLCSSLLPHLTDLAAQLLRQLQIRPRLGAWRFLPHMVALVTLHPQLLTRISATLYPMIGARFGLSPAAVERSLRIAVESAWSTSPLLALEFFFGQSIDPDKGKPTNREFLCQMAEHLRLNFLA